MGSKLTVAETTAPSEIAGRQLASDPARETVHDIPDPLKDTDLTNGAGTYTAEMLTVPLPSPTDTEIRAISLSPLDEATTVSTHDCGEALDHVVALDNGVPNTPEQSWVHWYVMGSPSGSTAVAARSMVSPIVGSTEDAVAAMIIGPWSWAVGAVELSISLIATAAVP
jgi:hypothetical protein